MRLCQQLCSRCGSHTESTHAGCWEHTHAWQHRRSALTLRCIAEAIVVDAHLAVVDLDLAVSDHVPVRGREGWFGAHTRVEWMWDSQAVLWLAESCQGAGGNTKTPQHCTSDWALHRVAHCGGHTPWARLAGCGGPAPHDAGSSISVDGAAMGSAKVQQGSHVSAIGGWCKVVGSVLPCAWQQL